MLKLNLSLEEAILGAGIMILDLKLLFPPKAEAAGCCMELGLGIMVYVLGMAILAVAAWSIAYIWQPNYPFSHKYSNFQGNSIHPHCPDP